MCIRDRFRDFLLEIDQAIAEDELNTAKTQLAALELDVISSANMKAQVAAAWYAVAEQTRAINLLEQTLNEDPSLAPYWHIQLGTWLLAQRDTVKLQQWHENRQRIAIETEEELAQVEQLSLDYKLLASDSPRTLLNTLIAESPFNMDGYARLASLCLLYTSPSPRDRQKSRMPSSA